MGNGFAVVAAEIQKLSQQSKEAAENIKEIVVDLNEHSSHAMNRMEETRAAVEKQTEDIRVNTIAIVQNSAAVSEENLASIEEIMAGIAKVYADIEKINEKAKMLNDHSVEMKDGVNVFSV